MDRAIYEGGSRKLLTLLRQLPESAEGVLLIGHNPALHELAVTLADVKSAGKLPSLTDKFPTAALASFRFDGSWAAMQAHQAAVISYLAPADIKDACRAQKLEPQCFWVVACRWFAGWRHSLLIVKPEAV